MPGFHYLGKRAGFGVLGRDLEIAADVVRDQFLHVFRRFDGQVVAYPEAIRTFLTPGRPRARR